MIDEREVSKRFNDAVVIPVERVFAGNCRIDEFELELKVFVVQPERLAGDGKCHRVAVDDAFTEAVYDIAIDLRTLFCVSTNQHEPEISKEMIEELKSKGWVLSKNVFGECLVLPKDEREKIIPALAKSLINWRITSNQARTFSLMETLAIAISDNANTIAGAIRAKLIDDGEKPKAKPIVDATAGANVFVTLPCANYIVTESESAEALQKAEDKLIEMMRNFDYENQL